MEVSTVGTTDHPQPLWFSAITFSVPSSITFSVPSSVDRQFFVPIALISAMGRHSWATLEQLDYLKSFVPLLPQAKETTSLETLYLQVYEGFLKKWTLDPVAPASGTSPSLEELEVKAKERLRNVSILPVPLHLLSVHRLQRISNWYKEERKKEKHSTLPYSQPAPRVLDLSGKSKRKKRPYQLYQAYSILYWQLKDSPLRHEVEDLWTR